MRDTSGIVGALAGLTGRGGITIVTILLARRQPAALKSANFPKTEDIVSNYWDAHFAIMVEREAKCGEHLTGRRSLNQASVVAAVSYVRGSSRLNRTHDVQVESISAPTNEKAIARGRHLVGAVTFCQECHGEDLGGEILENDPGIGTISAPNLTAGRGGVGATYSDADYVRAIRHGVNPQGRGLIIMHSDIYHNLSEQDLGALIAYFKSRPPVDNEVPETNIQPLGRIFVGLGMFDMEGLPLIPVEVIDHSARFVAAPPEGATAAYGEYLTSITLCSFCHGADLAGAPPLEPGMPPAPNLTPGGELASWSEADFMQTMRTGVTPQGHEIDAEFMPWDVFANMTDDELRAAWTYLQSLPTKESSN